MTGGGSKSSNWMQVFADVLEEPLVLARTPEVGARGAVLAGAEARGEELDVAQWTSPEGVVEPNDANRALYDAGFAAPDGTAGGRQAALAHPRRDWPPWGTRSDFDALAVDAQGRASPPPPPGRTTWWWSAAA